MNLVELTPTARQALQDMRAAREKSDAMLKLQRSLAFEQATSVIETSCMNLDGDVFDTGDVAPGDEASVAQAVEYLEWRSLLLRTESNPKHVMVLDESEEA